MWRGALTFTIFGKSDAKRSSSSQHAYFDLQIVGGGARQVRASARSIERLTHTHRASESRPLITSRGRAHQRHQMGASRSNARARLAFERSRTSSRGFDSAVSHPSVER